MSNSIPDTPDNQERLGWLDTVVDGHPVWFWIIIGLLIAAAVLGFGAWWTYGWDHDPQALAPARLA